MKLGSQHRPHLGKHETSFTWQKFVESGCIPGIVPGTKKQPPQGVGFEPMGVVQLTWEPSAGHGPQGAAAPLPAFHETVLLMGDLTQPQCLLPSQLCHHSLLG